MTRKMLVFTMVLGLGYALSAQTGEEIMRRVRDRENNRTMQSRVQMILTSKDGNQTERMLDQYSVRRGGVTKTVIIFHRPANVAYTRFLVISSDDQEDQRWIFLPSLNRVRRIAGAEGSSSFVGTDFTYDDLSLRQLDRDNHKLLREETLNNDRVYVVESTPKVQGDSQYSKVVSYILADKWLPVRIEMFDRQGQLLKKLTAGNIEKVQDVWTYRSATMENVQSGTQTQLNLQLIQFNARIPDSVFTTKFLETGRP